MKQLFYLFFATLIFAGCGKSSHDEDTKPTIHTKEQRASLFITKGNFLEVANFAYKRATDSDFTDYSLEVPLPGRDTNKSTQPSTYTITEKRDSSDNLKKIIVHNYENSVELKFLNSDKVSVLFKNSDFSLNKQLTLTKLQNKY